MTGPWGADLHHYGLAGIFLMVAIENLGIPFPTAPAYILGQGFIATGQYPPLAIHAVLLAGHTFGSVVSYFAGLRIAEDFLKKDRTYTAVQHKIAGWYDRYGAPTVFGARLIGYVRPWTSYVAGIAELNFWQFLGLTVAGTLVWDAVCLAFTTTALHLWNRYPLAKLLMIASLLVGVIFVAVGLLRKLGKRGKL